VRVRYPDDAGRVERVSLIDEGATRHVRMAHLAIVGSHSTNGVAALHSELLKQRVVPDFAAMFPERFNNKTNGVTPRRWLLLANPSLAAVITKAIGDGWITDLAQLEKLKPLAGDKAFCTAVATAKRQAKLRFMKWLGRPEIDPDTIFDTQIKRIHEYKRQLLNALHVVVLYHRLRESPWLSVPRPREDAVRHHGVHGFAICVASFATATEGWGGESGLGGWSRRSDTNRLYSTLSASWAAANWRKRSTVFEGS
jgi:starch phosphorylase